MQSKSEGTSGGKAIGRRESSPRLSPLFFFKPTPISPLSRDVFSDLAVKVYGILQSTEVVLKQEHEMETLSENCRRGVKALFGWINISISSMLQYLNCPLVPTNTMRLLSDVLSDFHCIAVLHGKKVSLIVQEDFVIDLSSPAISAYLKALHNVMDNALKYSNSTITIKVTAQHGNFHTTIFDDGPRIPLEVVQKIFDLSEARVERNPTHMSWGNSWGMGLSCSIRMLTQYQGAVLYSEQGDKHVDVSIPNASLRKKWPKPPELTADELKTSFFYDLHNLKNDMQKLTLVLPEQHPLFEFIGAIKDAFKNFKFEREDNLLGKSDNRRNSGENRPKIPAQEAGVVIVDDDTINHKILTALILKFGIRKENIHCFSSPSEALAFLDQHTMDVVLTDFEMPEFSGLEFASKAQQMFSEHDKICPALVLISGNSETPMQKLFSHVAVKPVGKDEIRNIFQELNISCLSPKHTNRNNFLGENKPLTSAPVESEADRENNLNRCNK